MVCKIVLWYYHVMEKMTKDYDVLIRAFEKFRTQELEEFRDYLSHPWRIIGVNFLAGTARGLGFLLGAATVITISAFITKHYLSHIPMVGEFFQAVSLWIEQTVKNIH